MHKAKKRKLEPVEPLQPPPVPVNLDELPADYVSPRTKEFLEATAPMSPEKTEVVRLTTEAICADECCNSLRKGMRECKRTEMLLKFEMYLKKKLQDRVPKARTKAELAERAADELEVAECKARYTKFRWDYIASCVKLLYARDKAHLARIARLERLLRDAGGEW